MSASRHTHDRDERLTFGCDACIERARADEFWTIFVDECENPDRDDVEFGLSMPIVSVWADHASCDHDGDLRRFMDYIPDGILTAILRECGDDTAMGDLMMVAAHRLEANTEGTAA